MKRTQLNLVLLVVAAGLGAAVFFSQKKETKGAPLTALAADSVTKISIDHPNAPAIHLEKRDGKWRLTAPVQAEADGFEIDGVTGIAGLETRSTLEPTQIKLADLGLDPPQYTVTLNDQKIEFGSVEPLQYRRYLKVGDKIALTDDPPSAALDADYSDLVAKNIVPGGARLKRIEVPGLSLSKSADGKSWALATGDDKAGNDQKQKMADSWQNAKALWNGAEPTEGSKGDAVKLTLEDGGELNFIIAQRDPQLILARPDLKVRYTLSKALGDELLKLPEIKKAEAPAALPGKK